MELLFKFCCSCNSPAATTVLNNKGYLQKGVKTGPITGQQLVRVYLKTSFFLTFFPLWWACDRSLCALPLSLPRIYCSLTNQIRYHFRQLCEVLIIIIIIIYKYAATLGFVAFFLLFSRKIPCNLSWKRWITLLCQWLPSEADQAGSFLRLWQLMNTQTPWLQQKRSKQVADNNSSDLDRWVESHQLLEPPPFFIPFSAMHNCLLHVYGTPDCLCF